MTTSMMAGLTIAWADPPFFFSSEKGEESPPSDSASNSHYVLSAAVMNQWTVPLEWNTGMTLSLCFFFPEAVVRVSNGSEWL